MKEEIREHFEVWNYFRNNILDFFPEIFGEKLNKLCLLLAKNDDKRLSDLNDLFTKKLEERWISVEDRLPEIGVYVLCYENGREPFVGCFDKNWWDYESHGHDVILWQPLPQLPKEKK